MVACYHRDTRSGLFCLVRMDFYTVGTGTTQWGQERCVKKNPLTCANANGFGKLCLTLNLHIMENANRHHDGVYLLSDVIICFRVFITLCQAARNG